MTDDRAEQEDRRGPVDAAQRLAEIRAQHAALTPGPWHWSGYKDRRGLPGPYLATWIPGQGRTTVMDTARLGMQGAQPRFNVDNRIVDGIDLAVREVPYRDDLVDIDHPDARFIAAAPQIVADLLDHIDALTAEREALRAALTDLYHARGKETMKVWDRVWRLVPQPDNSPPPVDGGQS